MHTKDYAEIQELLTQWLNDYSLKNGSESDEVWLTNKLKKELPQLSDDKCIKFSSDAIATIQIYNDKKESLHIEISKGMAQESWLEKELEASSKGMNAIQYGTYLSSIDKAISEANKDLAQTITTRDGNINNNPNLFGYLFESEHVASFNMDAALKGNDYRAEVLRPVPGTNYEKNSADIAIFDKKGTTVQLVQAKCYSNADASNKAFEAGDYSGQERLVPDGHVQNGISDSKLNQSGVESTSITVEHIKKEQENIQQDGIIPNKSWNNYTNKKLALYLGKQAGIAGLQGAAMGGAFAFANCIIDDKEIDSKKIAESVIRDGAKSGATCAVAGALKVYIERHIPKKIYNVIPTTPLPLPPIPFPPTILKNPTTIGMIASTAVDSACIAYKVAQNEISVGDGVREIEQCACSVVAGTVASIKGSTVGATIGAILGPIGAGIGGFMGGTLGYVAGSTVGRAVCAGAQKLRDSAWEKAKKIGDSIAAAGKTVMHGIQNACSSIANFFGF